MAITVFATLATLVAVAGFALLMAGVGSRTLRWTVAQQKVQINLEQPNQAEHLLTCIGLGVVVFELGTLLVAVLNILRPGIWILLALCALFALLEFSRLRNLLRDLWQKIRSAPRNAKLIQATFFTVLCYAAIAAMAPLTGSDALHYHFTEPLLILHGGYHPNFFSTDCFLLGQGHLLILAGLALGSEKLALGLLFLGGALAALAGACVARHWMPATGAWMVALAFAVTPVVFWQMSIAGTPDLWMTFYVTMAVLMVARAAGNKSLIYVLLAGVFTGVVAGTKYTGCIFALAIAIALLAEIRSLKSTAFFALASLSSGIWPYLRNTLWTGDPVFPFLMPRLHPEHTNAFAMAAFLAETGSATQHSFLYLLRFPLFAAMDPKNIGVWQFLGPVCLALLPLVFFAIRKTPLWRTVLIVWFISTVGIGLTSGLLRFTVPVFPLGLAAVFAGLFAIPRKGWTLVRATAYATIALFLAMSAGGVLLYGRPAVKASLGITSRQEYLAAVAPDSGRVQFINETLQAKTQQGSTQQGKALVFFRHLYYLQVPFLYGNPDASWSIDPTKLSDARSWTELFQRENIRWIVKAPAYPKSLADSLQNLESQGILIPIADKEVDDIAGNRLDGHRATTKITILEVHSIAP
jgi:4-amino-4-deoxy-L-arabinose transferase-like glycosyltransferase